MKSRNLNSIINFAPTKKKTKTSSLLANLTGSTYNQGFSSRLTFPGYQFLHCNSFHSKMGLIHLFERLFIINIHFIKRLSEFYNKYSNDFCLYIPYSLLQVPNKKLLDD
jgi:hypothetical protein